MIPHPLTLLGWLLEGIGLIVSIAGVIAFGREPSDTPLFAPQRHALRRLRDRNVAALRRLTGRRRSVVAQAGLAEGLAVSLRARGRVTYGPLQLPKRPKVAEVAAAVRELERRSNIAWTSLTDLREKVEDDVERLAAADTELEARIAARLAESAQRAGQMATHDVEVQLIGLGLIALGFVIQTVGIFAS
jgi:hypothetical protein